MILYDLDSSQKNVLELSYNLNCNSAPMLFQVVSGTFF